jgi:hypothetical protein
VNPRFLPPSTIAAMLRWDLFCRVIDNHGDIGVCWRLAADLAARGQRVRLWIDDAAPLAWMAPGGSPGVEVLPGRCGGRPPPGDVVDRGLRLRPAANASAMAGMAGRPAPVWINLEYLSADIRAPACSATSPRRCRRVLEACGREGPSDWLVTAGRAADAVDAERQRTWTPVRPCSTPCPG